VSSTGIGYAAAVALAAIFAIAAVAKLRDVSATERDFAGLGIPRASFFARFVPIAELSIVALLLIVPPAGAIAALVSLAFFTTFLIGRLRAGVRAPCACFGSSRAQPISVRDVIRNLLLMALAVVSLATDQPTAIAPLDALAVLAVIAAAGGALHLAGRVRSQ
jgi:uncharacterized membrane protein YphA (DoxX/SURF4 family)